MHINTLSYNITITPKNACERFLGVYTNGLNNQVPTTKKLHSIVHAHLSLTFFLSLTSMMQIITPLKKLYKSFLSLPLSMPDSVLHNPIFIPINSIYYNQIKNQIVNFIALANNPHTLSLTKLCFMQVLIDF